MLTTAVLLVLLWPLVLCGLVYLAVDAELTAPIRARLTGFLARLLSCQKCSAGWLAAPAAVAVAACSWIPVPWAWIYGLAIVAPPAGIGLVVILSLLSPSTAVGIAFREMDKRRGNDG